MKWETDWWGVTITAEDEADNSLIDGLARALPEITEDCYEEGELQIKTDDGLKSVIFRR